MRNTIEVLNVKTLMEQFRGTGEQPRKGTDEHEIPNPEAPGEKITIQFVKQISHLDVRHFRDPAHNSSLFRAEYHIDREGNVRSVEDFNAWVTLGRTDYMLHYEVDADNPLQASLTHVQQREPREKSAWWAPMKRSEEQGVMATVGRLGFPQHVDMGQTLVAWLSGEHQGEPITFDAVANHEFVLAPVSE